VLRSGQLQEGGAHGRLQDRRPEGQGAQGAV